jgi:hypothetical protein
MLVGLVSLPVPPVKAPSPNSSSLLPKPFTCYTSGKSHESSRSLKATSDHLDSTLGYANSFTFISFADPHPLNSVLSYHYKNIGGRVSPISVEIHLHSIRTHANSSAVRLLSDPHPLSPYRSIFYKIMGEGGAVLPTFQSLPTGTPISRSALGFANRPIFHSLPNLRTHRTIPTTRRLPLEKPPLLY